MLFELEKLFESSTMKSVNETELTENSNVSRLYSNPFLLVTIEFGVIGFVEACDSIPLMLIEATNRLKFVVTKVKDENLTELEVVSSVSKADEAAGERYLVVRS